MGRERQLRSTRAHVCVYVLGEFRVERDGAVVPASAWLKRGSARALVKVLTIAPQRRLHREQVIDALWPDDSPQRSHSALRQALHAARHAMGASTIGSDREMVWLDTDSVWTDADEFRLLANRARQGGGADIKRQALSLYRGELLPADRHHPWTEALRETLSLEYVSLLESFARHLERDHLRSEALDQWRKVAVLNPSNDEAHRAILRNHLPAPIAESPPTPLVGHEVELGRLMEGLKETLHGSGSVVLVRGEAGIGKTRVAAEVAREAHRRGCVVLWGSYVTADRWIPYGALNEAMETALANAPALKLNLALRYPDLQTSFPFLRHSPTGTVREPSVSADMTPDGTSSPLGATSITASFVSMLRYIAGSRPLVIVLDAIDLADGSSLRLVHYLARSAPDLGLLLVLTFREEETARNEGFETMVNALSRRPECRSVTLRCLDQTDCGRLATLLLPTGKIHPTLLRRLSIQSAGNPLFLRELIEALRTKRHLSLQNDEWVYGIDDRVPTAIQALVERRLRRLPEEAYSILSLATVIGVEFTYEALLASVRCAGMPISDMAVLDALDTGSQARLLTDLGHAFSFHHPFFRSVLYETIPARRRAEMHRAVGEALRSLAPEQSTLLTYHGRKGQPA